MAMKGKAAEPEIGQVYERKYPIRKVSKRYVIIRGIRRDQKPKADVEVQAWDVDLKKVPMYGQTSYPPLDTFLKFFILAPDEFQQK